MTREQRDRLRRLAEAATPGPWTRKRPTEGEFGFASGTKVAGCGPGCGVYANPPGGSFPSADASFIEGANPQTVLSLLDALEETEKALEQAVEIGYLRYVDGFERVGASFNGTTHFPNSGVAHDELAAHLKKRADK